MFKCPTIQSLVHHSNWWKYPCVIAAIFTLSNTNSSQFQTCVSNPSHRDPTQHSAVLPVRSRSVGGSTTHQVTELKPWLLPLLHMLINHQDGLSASPPKYFYTTLPLHPHCSLPSSSSLVFFCSPLNSLPVSKIAPLKFILHIAVSKVKIQPPVCLLQALPMRERVLWALTRPLHSGSAYTCGCISSSFLFDTL